MYYYLKKQENTVMTSEVKLSGPVTKSIEKTKKLVFFLHGWGSDGNDLIQISYHWKNELQKISFIAPNGPEICHGNPNGKQWFNILTDDNKEINKGLQKSFELLDEYIDLNLNNFNLGKEDFFLVGFSQGTMLSLFTSIRRRCSGVIGYSGAFLDTDLPNNIVKNDILLIHGAADTVVPPIRMEHAKNQLKNMSKSLETKLFKNLEHSINDEGLQLGCGFIKKRL